MYQVKKDDVSKLTEITREKRVVTSFATLNEINYVSDANLTDLVVELNFLVEEIELLRRRLARHYDY